MEHHVNEEKKDSITKSLALFGLVALIILIAWLSVQIVKIFPSAINSLASLADTVYRYDHGKENDFVSEADKSVNSGETVTLKWKNLGEGDYTFSYQCFEGLSVDLKTPHTDIKNVECGIRYDIGTVGTMDLIARGAKSSSTDLSYTISHYSRNSTVPEAEESGLIAVINPNIKLGTVNETEEPTKDTTPEVKPTTTATPTAKPTPTQSVTYALPVSDPKGFSDLKITFLNIGQVNKAGTYTANGYFTTTSKNAIRFAVKNIGTKNSETWSLEVDLPGDLEYSATGKAMLKPNEEAILTIEFPALTIKEVQKFGASIETKNDKTTSNNRFTSSGLTK